MQRFTTMALIGELLKEKNIILKGADVLSARGFTQVPNHVLKSDQLSPGAKLAYEMLLSYAWQNDYCFPGQERLAKDMGAPALRRCWKCRTARWWASSSSSPRLRQPRAQGQPLAQSRLIMPVTAAMPRVVSSQPRAMCSHR